MKTLQFERPTKAEWEKKAAADLRTEDLASLINWEPFKGLTTSAYFDRSDDDPKALTSFFGHLKKDPWVLLQEVSVDGNTKEANRKALSALNQGATGVLFASSSKTDSPGSLFKGILPEHCHLAFKGNTSDELASEFVKQSGPSTVKGLVINGKKIQAESKEFKSLGIIVTSHFDIVPELVRYLQELDKYRRIYGDRFIDYLNVSVKIDQKFYQSVALIKAIRWLTHLYVSTENIDFEAEHLHVNVTIGISGDYKNDLLTNTSSGVAAIAGGADSISFELRSDKGDDFNERIARNIGNLLRDESRLDISQDPTAGSYFLDNLTNTISELSWNQYISQS